MNAIVDRIARSVTFIKFPSLSMRNKVDSTNNEIHFVYNEQQNFFALQKFCEPQSFSAQLEFSGTSTDKW